jgi:hypothetical protein
VRGDKPQRHIAVKKDRRAAPKQKTDTPPDASASGRFGGVATRDGHIGHADDDFLQKLLVFRHSFS